jgi:uncharacterized protein YbjT (DUF2867 family)
MGAERLFFVPHRKLEKEIMRLGFDYSFLRAGFFMQNLDAVFAGFIREHRELPVPAGSGRTSFVDTRDIAEAAYRVLTAGSPPRSRAYTLTGWEAFDYHGVAALLSEELGHEIRYTNPSLREFTSRATASGWDPTYTKVVGRLFSTVRFGMAETVTKDLPILIGRPPGTLQRYIRDYRNVWTGGG